MKGEHSRDKRVLESVLKTLQKRCLELMSSSTLVTALCTAGIFFVLTVSVAAAITFLRDFSALTHNSSLYHFSLLHISCLSMHSNNSFVE